LHQVNAITKRKTKKNDTLSKHKTKALAKWHPTQKLDRLESTYQREEQISCWLDHQELYQVITFLPLACLLLPTLPAM
jgi:hypothetical protein